MDNNVWVLIVLILFAMMMFILWYHGQKEFVKRIIIYLILEAENKFGFKTGEIKHAWVYDNIYSRLPGIVARFITPAQLDRWIVDGVDKMNRALQDELEKP